MMTRPNLPTFAGALALSLALAAPALAITAGQPAPAFAENDAQGAPVRLADFKGRYVVLEWTNPECPFVRNHYATKNMQSLQKEWGGRDVAWLTINSTNTSSGEFTPPAKMIEWMRGKDAAQKAVLIDGDSSTARLYGAKTTPEMVVIDPAGKVIYAGAIDDKPSTRPDDPPRALNYVRTALAEATAGKSVTTATTTPYGCSIKY